MLSASSSGSFDKTLKSLQKLQNGSSALELDGYGKQGVTALSSATPIESGQTREGWGYQIKKTKSTIKVVWTNDHVEDEVMIAIILQYGHATRTGGWVEGRDYINPAMRPIFDAMAQKMWEEVTRNG